MTAKGFIFLMLVAIGAVMVAGTAAEQFTEPGLARTLVVALITSAILFPAARWGERKGWIKGGVRLDKLGEEFGRRRLAPRQTSEASTAPTAPATPTASTTPSSPAGTTTNNNNQNPGDPR